MNQPKLNKYTFSFTQARKVDFLPMSFTVSRQQVIKRLDEEQTESRYEARLVEEFFPETVEVNVQKKKDHLITGTLISQEGIRFDDVEKVLRYAMIQPVGQNILSVEDTRYKDCGLVTWHLNTNEGVKVNVDEAYWVNCLAMKREDFWVVPRLVSVLKGFYLEDCWFHNVQPTRQGLIDFTDSKRPYGNKDLEASIAFNLGWDWAGVLTRVAAPKMIQDEANRLHDLVIKKVTSEADDA